MCGEDELWLIEVYMYSRSKAFVAKFIYTKGTLTSGINVEGLINVEAAPFSKINKRRGLKNPK